MGAENKTSTLFEIVQKLFLSLKSDQFPYITLFISTAGKVKNRVHARSFFCYWAVRELGMVQKELSHLLKISFAAVTKSAQRGEALEKE
jgi:hypothetical protein